MSYFVWNFSSWAVAINTQQLNLWQMSHSVWDAFSWALGLNAEQISIGQMGLRAAVIYVAALIMIRLGGQRRFLGKHAAVDVILGIIFGSVLSRAINGSAPFFPSLGAGLVLVGMHWLFATLAFYFEGFDGLIKGSPLTLIENGQIDRQAMRKTRISSKDLELTLRLKEKLSEPTQVKLARLESSGDISITPREELPQMDRLLQLNQLKQEN